MKDTAFANRERTATEARPPVQSLSKALDVLEAFSFDRPELSLGELSRAVGLAKSTVHKVARTLVDRGYLVQDPPSRRYRLGLSAWHLGNVAVAPLDVRAVAAGHLRHLASETGEQVTLWVLERELAICVDRVDSAHQVRTFTRLGTALDPHELAAGRCLLAWHETDPGDPQLRRIRRLGYDLTDRDHTNGVGGVSAPVHGPHASAVAAVTVSGPAERFDATDITRLLPRLLKTVSTISSELGYPTRTTPIAR